MPSPIQRRDLPLLLAHARDAVVAGFRPVFQRLGLTEQQWRIVRTLGDQGPMEPRELAEACRISKPSLTGMLVRMETAGLVGRERLQLDQRRLIVTLTVSGESLLARAAPMITREYDALEAVLGPDRFETVCAALAELVELPRARSARTVPTSRRRRSARR